MRKTDSSLFLELDCRLQWSEAFIKFGKYFNAKYRFWKQNQGRHFEKIGYFTGVHSQIYLVSTDECLYNFGAFTANCTILP